MPVLNPVRTVSREHISCGGVTKVTLGFTAVPELASRPADIVLVLDRSSSMTPERLRPMQEGAKALLDKIAAASGSSRGTALAGGTRAALVTYASSAAAEVPLSTSVPELKGAIDRMTAGGMTGHADAITTAQRLFDPCSENRRVLVLFTDGPTNAGGDPMAAVWAAKDAGTEVFCIGLEGGHLPPLEEWASFPADRHAAGTADPAALPGVFSALGAEIVRAGASGARLREAVGPDFRIVHVDQPVRGSVTLTPPGVLDWDIGTCGDEGPEEVRLTCEILHVGSGSGVKRVSRGTDYRDRNCACLTFPEAVVTVDCECPEEPDPCPPSELIRLDGCQETAAVDLAAVSLSALGRLIELNVTIRDVCPGKRVAAAVLLTEVGPCGQECPRGMKTFVIPAHKGEGCRDVTLRCVRFVVPEELDGCGEGAGTLCRIRTFRARVEANYIDTDVHCCEADIVLH